MAEDPAPQHTDTQPTDNDVDADLVTRVVNGDDDAYLELFRRHAFPAWRLALAVAGSTAGAVSAVAEGFTRVFARARDTNSQPVSFRLAVVSATRQAAIAEAKTSRVDDHAGSIDESTLLHLFHSLPERWRSVLWLVVAEGGTAAQASPLLGLSVDGTELLLERAADGLRERYIEGARAATSEDACQTTLDRLADDTLDVDDAHVEGCDDCQARAAALLNLRRGLRTLVIPLPMVLGDASLAHWHAWLGENAGRRAGVLPVWAERAMGAAAAGVIGIALLGAVLLGARSRDHGPELAAPLGEVATGGESALASPSALPGGGFTFPRAGTAFPVGGSSGFPLYQSGGAFGRGSSGVPSVPAPSTPAPTTPPPTQSPPPQEQPPAPTGLAADLNGAGVPVAAEISEECVGLEIGELPPIGCDPSAPANGGPIDATLPPPLGELLDPILAPLDPILCGLLGCG